MTNERFSHGDPIHLTLAPEGAICPACRRLTMTIALWPLTKRSQDSGIDVRATIVCTLRYGHCDVRFRASDFHFDRPDKFSHYDRPSL